MSNVCMRTGWISRISGSLRRDINDLEVGTLDRIRSTLIRRVDQNRDTVVSRESDYMGLD